MATSSVLTPSRCGSQLQAEPSSITFTPTGGGGNGLGPGNPFARVSIETSFGLSMEAKCYGRGGIDLDLLCSCCRSKVTIRRRTNRRDLFLCSSCGGKLLTEKLEPTVDVVPGGSYEIFLRGWVDFFFFSEAEAALMTIILCDKLGEWATQVGQMRVLRHKFLRPEGPLRPTRKFSKFCQGCSGEL